MPPMNFERNIHIPDGGWGWMIVFASFMMHVIADGVIYTFGIFHNEIENEYQQGSGYTSWIASLMVGVALIAGPLSSALTNRFGCRVISILGSCFAFIGFSSSIFAKDIYPLFFTLGILSGFGFSLMYVSAIVSVSYYFEKKRAFATGIAVCGSGIGTFLFAPLIQYLIEIYYWKGAILVVSSIILNCCMFGCILRPLEIQPKEVILDSNELILNKNKTFQVTTENKSQFSHMNNNRSMNHPAHPEDYVSSEYNDMLKVSSKYENMNIIKHINRIKDANVLSNSAPLLFELSNKSKGIKKLHQSHLNINISSRKFSWQGVMYTKDIWYNRSILSVETKYSKNLDLEVSKSVQIWKCIKIPGEIYDTFKEMTDFSLLKTYTFLIFTVSNIFTSIGFGTPFIYIMNLALEKGVSYKESNFLLSIMGISNTCSRIGLGYISDKGSMNRLWIYNLALITCGIDTILCPLCNNYFTFSVYSVIFGITSGVYVNLISVILVDLFGLDKLTNAFGLILMFQGIASLIGPPITGWLYDSFKSYHFGFYFSGFVIFISGIIASLIPFRRKSTSGFAALGSGTI